MGQFGDCMQRSGGNASSIDICEANKAKQFGEVKEKLEKKFGPPYTTALSISEYDLLVPYEDVTGMTRQAYHAALSRLHDEFTRLLAGRVESPGNH